MANKSLLSLLCLGTILITPTFYQAVAAEEKATKTVEAAEKAMPVAEKTEGQDSAVEKKTTKPAKHRHHRKHRAGVQHGREMSDGVTLEQAVLTAVQTNPEIMQKSADRNAAEYRKDQEIGAYFPKLDLSGGTGWARVKENIKPNRLSSGARGTVSGDRHNIGATLTQKIFDGLETPNRIDKARKEIVQADMNIREANILIAYNAANQFIATRRFQRLVKLAKENVSMHRDILGKVSAMTSAGTVSRGELESVKSRLDDAMAAVADIQGDLDTAIANYIEVVGVEPDRLARVSINEAKLPSNLQEAIDIAVKNNRSLKVIEAAAKVAEADLEVTKAPFMPSIDFQVDAQRLFDTGGRNGTENDLTGLFVAKFNAFNGGRDLNRYREFREKLVSAKRRTDVERRKTEKEVRVSYAEYMSARGQSAALRQAVVEKNKLRLTYLEQFNTGKANYVQILDATHEYFLAKGSLITADAAMDLAAMRLLAAMGRLFELYNTTY